MREIILPETKPALEWVNGRALQKVSPKRKHALAQIQFAAALNAWARRSGAGMVGTEWRFKILPPGEERRPLVPDVAFLSYARMPYDIQLYTDEPEIAPDAVVEVQSATDSQADILEKVRVYLAAGTTVVFLVDTEQRIVTVCDRSARRVVEESATLTHTAMPGFELAIIELFTPPQPK
jgi:Uma2 family endonuclease